MLLLPGPQLLPPPHPQLHSRAHFSEQTALPVLSPPYSGKQKHLVSELKELIPPPPPTKRSAFLFRFLFSFIHSLIYSFVRLPLSALLIRVRHHNRHWGYNVLKVKVHAIQKLTSQRRWQKSRETSEIQRAWVRTGCQRGSGNGISPVWREE